MHPPPPNLSFNKMMTDNNNNNNNNSDNNMMNLDDDVVDNPNNNITNDNTNHHPHEESLVVSQEENLNIQQEQHDEKEVADEEEQQKQINIQEQEQQEQVQHHDEKVAVEDNEQQKLQLIQHQQPMKKYKKATKYDNHYKFPKDLLLFLNTVSDMKKYNNNDKVVEWSISDHHNHNNNNIECHDDEYRNDERCTIGESEENNNNNNNNNMTTNITSNHNHHKNRLLYSSFLINRNHIDLPHLLEQFFGHFNFDSLRRQLNMYAFRLNRSGRFERAKGSYPFHRDMTSNDLICIKPRPNISRNIRDQEKRSTKIYKYNSKHNNHKSSSKKNNNVEVVETKRKYNKKQKFNEKIENRFSVNNEIKKNVVNVEEMDEDNEEHQSDDDGNSDDDDDQSSTYDSSLSTYVTLGPLDTETIKELEKLKTYEMMDDVIVDDYEVLCDTSIDNQKEEGLDVTLDENNIYHQQDLIDNENNDDNNKEPIPEAKFKVYQKVYAADKDGLLYEAVIRRCLYGPQYQKQVQMGCITSTIEADKILEKWNHEPKESIWHYFVHYNKWSVNFDRWIPENYVYDILETQVKEFAIRLMKESRVLQSEMKRKTKTINGTLYLEEWKKRSIQLANEMKFQYRYNHILWYDADDPGRFSRADTTTTKVDKSMDDMVEEDEDTVKDHRSRKSKKGTKSTSSSSSSASSSIWTKASLILEKKYRDKGLTSKRCNVNTNTDIHQIIIPFVLKKIMVESWEITTHCQMLSNIPCSITIRQALHLYLKSKNVIIITTSDTEAIILKEGDDVGNNNLKEEEVVTSPPTDDTTSITPPPTDDTTSMIIDENKAVIVVDDDIIKKKDRDQEWIDMIDGIIMLFDEALPYHLLYREEMLQLQTLDDSIEYNMKSYSDIYGCEHLLRLFVRLPNMFNDILDSSKNNNDTTNNNNGIIDQMKQIYGKVNDLLRFLHKNYNTIFIQTHRKLNEMEIKEQQKRMISMNGGNANSSTTTTTAVEKSSSSKKRKKN